MSVTHVHRADHAERAEKASFFFCVLSDLSVMDVRGRRHK